MNEKELKHFGILGMHWGVRKSYEQAHNKIKKMNENEITYRQKLSNIQTSSKKQKNVAYGTKQDIVRFKRRNKPLGIRVAKHVSRRIARTMIMDTLFMRDPLYHLKGKRGALFLANIGLGTGVNVALDDALAKSASKRYDDKGRQIKKTSFLSKETKIEMGIKFGLGLSNSVSNFMAIKSALANSAKDKEATDNILKKIGAAVFDLTPDSSGVYTYDPDK
jgi:hypothetical protein